jgi:ribose 1,5-bisphosphokinase PhnN
MFILVDDFNGDVSNCGENKRQGRESKENLCENLKRDEHFVIGINHVQTLQHGDKKTIKIENNFHAKRKSFCVWA